MPTLTEAPRSNKVFVPEIVFVSWNTKVVDWTNATLMLKEYVAAFAFAGMVIEADGGLTPPRAVKDKVTGAVHVKITDAETMVAACSTWPTVIAGDTTLRATF